MANQGSKEIRVVQINCIALFTTTPQDLVIIAIVGDSTASFLVGWLGRLGASLPVMPRYAAQHGTNFVDRIWHSDGKQLFAYYAVL
jgi:hypothetical protein